MRGRMQRAVRSGGSAASIEQVKNELRTYQIARVLVKNCSARMCVMRGCLAAFADCCAATSV